MTEKNRRRAAGAAAGAVNGLFGGGGGMVLLPLLTKDGNLSRHAAFATCIAAIYPMCVVSAASYCLRLRPEWSAILPYLAGGAVGGIIAGITFQKVPVRVLKLIFGAFLIYGGARYLI